MRPLPSPSLDHLDIMRHGNGCTSVKQHLENLKVVPDGVDDDDDDEEEEEREGKDDDEDGDDDGIRQNLHLCAARMRGVMSAVKFAVESSMLSHEYG